MMSLEEGQDKNALNKINAFLCPFILLTSLGFPADFIYFGFDCFVLFKINLEIICRMEGKGRNAFSIAETYTQRKS